MFILEIDCLDGSTVRRFVGKFDYEIKYYTDGTYTVLVYPAPDGWWCERHRAKDYRLIRR